MYDSDIKDKEWAIVKELLIVKRRGPKVPERELRNKLNGLLYLLKTGCQWRMLPKEYGPWGKIYQQFRRWRDSKILEKALSAINKKVRIGQGREETP